MLVVAGGMLMLFGLVADHCRRMGKGDNPQKVWAGTGRMATVVFVVFGLMLIVDLLLKWMKG